MRRLGLLAAIVVVAIAVFAAWYLLIRDNSPPPVDLGAAIASVQTPQPAQATAVPTAAASRAVTASPVATATPTATASSVATANPVSHQRGDGRPRWRKPGRRPERHLGRL